VPQIPVRLVIGLALLLLLDLLVFCRVLDPDAEDLHWERLGEIDRVEVVLADGQIPELV